MSGRALRQPDLRLFRKVKMKVAIIGQQDFGKAVLNAFLERGDEVAGVFVAPDKEGAKPDPLKVAAQEKGLKLFQFPSYRKAEAQDALRELDADIGIMAYVLLFAPQEFVNIPKHGTIQYHPSLLPLHRGPSSINWPIIWGSTRTGLTIFRPDDGLDEGPVVLQKECEIGADETIGDIYFNKLFPIGVKAMLEAADLVVAGKHTETVQDESTATYEGWCRSAAAHIDWTKPIDQVYNLIRGCNPAPGAWTSFNGAKLQIFDARKVIFRKFGDVVGKMGEVSDVTDSSFKVTAQGGRIEVLRVKAEGGKKVAAGEFATANGLKAGAIL
ncbi:MAG TPA: methionyl-tRNA formyltransferase, partial [Burkholderiales bacterium]|nr:methionyl-tRNA formyltransferase [Burkholderiales bacterium]